MSEETYNNIVIDQGSHKIRAGIAGGDAPSVVFDTLVGQLKPGITDTSVDPHPRRYIGGEALRRSGILNLTCPIQNGIIVDYNAMEDVWQYTFDELHVDPSEHCVLLTAVPDNPKRNREKTTTVLFETFGVSAIYEQLQTKLALYSDGRTTGIGVDSGDHVSHVAPFYEHYSLPHAFTSLCMGGRDVTGELMKSLALQGHSITTTAEKEAVRDMKEKLCYVAENFETEMEDAVSSSAIDKTYEMPDGRVITIGAERISCPECLFNPISVDIDQPGIHEKIFQSIMKCDADIRKELYSNIVLSGGNSLFPGFAERVRQELVRRAPARTPVRVIAAPMGVNAAWNGGSILAALDFFQQSWVTKEDYDESGPTVIHRKCFL